MNEKQRFNRRRFLGYYGFLLGGLGAFLVVMFLGSIRLAPEANFLSRLLFFGILFAFGAILSFFAVWADLRRGQKSI